MCLLYRRLVIYYIYIYIFCSLLCPAHSLAQAASPQLTSPFQPLRSTWRSLQQQRRQQRWPLRRKGQQQRRPSALRSLRWSSKRLTSPEFTTMLPPRCGACSSTRHQRLARRHRGSEVLPSPGAFASGYRCGELLLKEAKHSGKEPPK